MNSLKFVRVVVVASTILGAASACGGSKATPAPAPQPLTREERFPRPQEVVVVDTSDTSPISPQPRMNFPLDIMSRRIEAAFGTIFIIDTLGHVEMPSVTFITETPPSLRNSVCEFVAKWRFAPVKRDNARRRAALVIPWVFARQGGALDGHKMDSRPITNSLRQRGFAAYVAELDTLPHCK